MTPPPARLNHLRERALAQGLGHFTHPSGTLGRYLEPPGNGLHQLFFLRLDGRDWVGRKTLQHDEHQALHISSLLRPSMLLGVHIDSQWSNEGVWIYFQTAAPEEKTAAFARALARPDSELRFPFALADEAGQEWVCPADFWQGTESLATQLNADETHYREHCAALLKPALKPGSLIYDPACSTGTFIAHLARELPECRCAGADRSASMIEYAKRRHAHTPVTFHVRDGCEAADPDVQCDALILRFLNAEVVTRQDAHTAFTHLVRWVKPGGTILVFGHTPVLLAVPWLAETLDLQVIGRVSARPGHEELFQFYHLTTPLR